MPPAGRPRPEPAARAALVGFLETELDRHAAAAPEPGPHRGVSSPEPRRVPQRRSRPARPRAGRDAAAAGRRRELWLRQHRGRAEDQPVAARAVPDRRRGASAARRSAVRCAAPSVHEYRVAETHASVRAHRRPAVRHARRHARAPPLPAGRRVRVPRSICCAGSAANATAAWALPTSIASLVLVDGEQVQEFTLEPRTELRPPAERTWRVRVPLKAGPHDDRRHVREAARRFARSTRRTSGSLRPFFLNGVIGQPHHTIYQPFLDVVRIVGPFERGRAPARRRAGSGSSRAIRSGRSDGATSCAPDDPADAGAARVPAAGHRRGPRAAAGGLPRRTPREGGFEAGIEAALQAAARQPGLPVSRRARSRRGRRRGTNYRISDLELASRLSFFLWSSIPDDALLDGGRTRAAEGSGGAGAAGPPDARAIARADALVENFAGQWLLLRNLEAHAAGPAAVPELRRQRCAQAARRETELFFGSVLRENRGVVELLTADYTFVNERLARHYGIPQDLRQRVPPRAR